MLQINDIQEAIQFNQTLAVYQLAILDFLNAAKTASDISGVEPSSGPISDDPKRGGKGYDIGKKVANRILKRRKELGGAFASLYQLAEIPYFGEDKLHDLIYTFMSLKAPVPTGLGKEFDDFIMALGQLEVAALRSGQSSKETLSSVRKLFYDKKIDLEHTEDTAKLDWDRVIPGSKTTAPPSVWAISSSLNKAMAFIEEHPEVRIGSEKVNIHTLITGLDARNHPDNVNTGSNKLTLASNLNVAGFQSSLASTTYAYLSPFSIKASEDFKIKEETLGVIYGKMLNNASFAAIGDIYTMEFESSRSLSWNLLNYYTQKEGPVKKRYQKLATSIGLGKYQDGLLSHDNPQTRTALLKDLLTTNFLLLKENGRNRFMNRMLSGSEEDSGFLTYKIASSYVLDLFVDRLIILVGLEINKPTIISWNRLEARPRKEDFSRTLRAEVRDALWFLSRQWQFGEFGAEDAGSALEMRVDMQTSQVDKFSLRGGAVNDFEGTIPMETIVERESVDIDLGIRIEMGIHFERLLRTELSKSPNGFAQNTIDIIILDFKNNPSFHFTYPEPKANFPEFYSNPALIKNVAVLVGGNALDGRAIYEQIEDGTLLSTFVISTTSVNALARVDTAGSELKKWFLTTYNHPSTPTDSAWNPKQLEYQFQCAVPSGGNARTVLNTTEYANGHLDWYSFDFETNRNNFAPNLIAAPIDSAKIHRKQITVLPTDLKYPGMPVPRWWQFEDFKVSLGDIRTNTNEIPKILMTEFALIYSNDWMLMPFDVEAGSLCDVKSVVVRDVFGQYTRVNAAGSGDNSDWRRWSMFNLNRKNVTSGAANTRLFVPPTVVRTMESEPIESVNFFRDEMSNMVWGVERQIPDGLGSAMEGNQAARRLYNYLVSITPEQPEEADTIENEAEIKYVLGTTVPEHWIPFIPMRIGGVNSRQIQLRRAAMPRIIKGRTPERIRPRTALLKTGYNPQNETWGPYFLHEEEVPRSGVIVNRSWQRTRWINGKTYTWLGRRVKNGRGEANSGLEFDNVNTKKGASN